MSDRTAREPQPVHRGGRALPAVAVIAASLLVAPVASAANLLANSGFDGGASGWQVLSEAGLYRSQWRAEDATGDVTSGSVRVEHLGDGSGIYFGTHQCVAAEGGATYQASARLRIPVGQTTSGRAQVWVAWFGATGCTSSFIIAAPLVAHQVAGGWAQATGSVVAPAGARAARIELGAELLSAAGTLAADFDDVVLDGPGVPAPPFSTWIRDAALPGFEAQVRITAGAAPLQGSLEADCIAETICAHGAVAGRAEVFVKVIGPRPNGFLWVQMVRFTPSKVEVWLRQLDTLEINFYELGAVGAGEGILPGLEDREAFVPP
jgi:hypothetical protein